MATYAASAAFTWAEALKRTDGEGKLLPLVNPLEQTNGILMDMPFFPTTDPNFNRSLIANSLPSGSVRKFNQGVAASQAATDLVIDNVKTIEDFSDMDEEIYETSDNPDGMRSQQDMLFIEGLLQRQAENFIYDNAQVDNTDIMGAAARMASLNSTTVVGAGGTGSDTSSIYFFQFGRGRCYATFPKNSTAGIDVRDKGKELIRQKDTDNYLYVMRTQFKLKYGFVVEDARCMGRIANIETSGAVNTFDWEDAIDVITQMKFGGKDAIAYCSRKIWAQIAKAAINKPNNWLSMQNVFGDGMLPTLYGVPVRLMEQIVDTETAIS